MNSSEQLPVVARPQPIQLVADSRYVTSMVTVSLAAALNLAVMLTVCFWVMPQINWLLAEVRTNRHQLKENHQLIQQVGCQLDAQRVEVERINQSLETTRARLERFNAELLKGGKGKQP